MPGGAAARPFVTHSNAFDIDLFLRIAPELFLKRAVVGGLERVFEMNRNFRNEGADRTHSPEFTMLEFYQAYADYQVMATITRELIQESAIAACGSLTVTHHDGSIHDLSGVWPQVDLYESLSAALGEQITPDTSREHLVALCEKDGIDVPSDRGAGQARRGAVRAPRRADVHAARRSSWTTPSTRPRWCAGIARSRASSRSGTSTSTARSPAPATPSSSTRSSSASGSSSRRRWALAATSRRCTSTRTSCARWSTGMPPMGGVGVGVDRVLMALTGLGIRETILFPLVKPEQRGHEREQKPEQR